MVYHAWKPGMAIERFMDVNAILNARMNARVKIKHKANTCLRIFACFGMKKGYASTHISSRLTLKVATP